MWFPFLTSLLLLLPPFPSRYPRYHLSVCSTLPFASGEQTKFAHRWAIQFCMSWSRNRLFPVCTRHYHSLCLPQISCSEDIKTQEYSICLGGLFYNRIILTDKNLCVSLSASNAFLCFGGALDYPMHVIQENDHANSVFLLNSHPEWAV